MIPQILHSNYSSSFKFNQSNYLTSIRSLVSAGLLSSTERYLAMAACSFDVHLLELLSPLIFIEIGGDQVKQELIVNCFYRKISIWTSNSTLFISNLIKISLLFFIRMNIHLKHSFIHLFLQSCLFLKFLSLCLFVKQNLFILNPDCSKFHWVWLFSSLP